MERFLRIRRLIGDQAFERLTQSHVTVVGIGAVGGYAIEALVRSGVGNIRIVDFDTIGITNINRQILAMESNLGKKKVDVAADRIRDINPNCHVEKLDLFAHDESMDQVLAQPIDILIDCIDSMSPKLSLLEAAYKREIKTFSSMGAALRTDPFAIVHSDLMKTHTCPLARQIRKKLKRRGVGKGIEVIYSGEQIEYTYLEPEDEEQSSFNEQILDRGRERKVLGSLPTITGIFGLMLGQLAIDSLITYQDR